MWSIESVSCRRTGPLREKMLGKRKGGSLVARSLALRVPFTVVHGKDFLIVLDGAGEAATRIPSD